MSLILNGTTGISDVDGTAAAPALTGTDSNTGIFFPAADTIAFAEGGVEAMRITSAGNVGIADTAPNYKFNVGPPGGVTSLNGAGISLFTSGGLTSSIGGVLNFRPSIGTTASDIFNLSICAFDHSGDTNADGLSINASDGISFCTGSNSRNERARIDSSGILSVGCTTGIGYVTQLNLSADSGTNKWATGPYAGNPAAYIIAANTNFGVYLPTTSATSWSSASDERLKENLLPIEDALSKVSSLRAVTGNFIADEEKIRKPFLIAQDLQAVLPEAVSVTPDGTHLGVSYTEVIPLLVAAIKEQQALITALTTRITALEGAA